MLDLRPFRLVDIQGRRFELVGTLGRGSFGDVYLATLQPPVGPAERVALKVLHPSVVPEPETLSRLRDEAARLRSLDHPFVLAPREVTEVDGRIALVAPYLEGAELGACLHGESHLPRGVLLEVIEQVAGALDAVWTSLGMVHRDVKPSSVRVGLLGEVRLLDFGAARRTKADVVVGTVSYVAPERFDPDREDGPAADVFSLGCILFEGFTGRRYHDQLNTEQMLELALDASAYEAYRTERLRGVRPGPAADLVAALLAHDPDARPSAAEVAWNCGTIAAKWPHPVTLRDWCRDRRWPRPGPPPSRADFRVPLPSTPAPAPVRGPAPARVVTPPDRPAPGPRRSLLAAGLGATGVALAALSLLFLLVGLYLRQREAVAPSPGHDEPLAPAR